MVQSQKIFFRKWIRISQSTHWTRSNGLKIGGENFFYGINYTLRKADSTRKSNS